MPAGAGPSELRLVAQAAPLVRAQPTAPRVLAAFIRVGHAVGRHCRAGASGTSSTAQAYTTSAALALARCTMQRAFRDRIVPTFDPAATATHGTHCNPRSAATSRSPSPANRRTPSRASISPAPHEPKPPPSTSSPPSKNFERPRAGAPSRRCERAQPNFGKIRFRAFLGEKSDAQTKKYRHPPAIGAVMIDWPGERGHSPSRQNSASVPA